MVGGKKKLFWNISIKHSIFLIIYIIMSALLSEIVIAGNNYIAVTTDRMLAGERIVLQNMLHNFSPIRQLVKRADVWFPLAGMIVAGSITAYGKSLSGNHYSALVQKEVRERLGEHLLKLPFSYFDEKNSGGVLTRFSSDIGEAGRFFSEILPELLVNIVTVITITVYFIQIDVRLILILFASYPVMWIASDRLSKKLAAILKKFRTGMDSRTQIAFDAIQGMTIGRSYQLYDIMCRRIGRVIDDTARHACKSTRISSMGWLIKGIITAIPEVICYLFALYEVLSGRITVGEMLAFTVLLSRMINPLGDIVFCINDIRTAKVAIDRLEEIYAYRAEAEQDDGVSRGNLSDSLSDQVSSAQTDFPAILWEQVRFSYQPAQPVLQEISFEIRQGERVAFVGGSGEGKSTIFRLLCGLYQKTGGSYLLYGKPFEAWDLKKVRECYSVVSQNVFLFPESILVNVACGKKGASMEEVINACKAANIHKFIEGLPEGYDTPAGERGIRLSGGEKQRISIARAFLKDAPIILLDEPTSAVDADTEKEIQEAIDRIARGKTVIVIAHRLSTIKDVKRIYVIKDGGIAESGSHDALLKKNGIYANLYGKEVSVNAI